LAGDLDSPGPFCYTHLRRYPESLYDFASALVRLLCRSLQPRVYSLALTGRSTDQYEFLVTIYAFLQPPAQYVLAACSATIPCPRVSRTCCLAILARTARFLCSPSAALRFVFWTGRSFLRAPPKEGLCGAMYRKLGPCARRRPCRSIMTPVKLPSPGMQAMRVSNSSSLQSLLA